MILFYDIPNKYGLNAWSPNTWKTRHALNFKGLEYKTIWVEYPDIADMCKQIGAPPTRNWPDGTPAYTLPVIQDLATGRVVAESFAIAEYLERAYPDTPPLFPHGSTALIWTFAQAFESKTLPSWRPLFLHAVSEQLNPVSEPHFRRLREIQMGCKLEELAPPEQRAEDLKKAEAAWGRMGKAVDKSGEGLEAPFVMGDQVSYADLILASSLIWVKYVRGVESEEWKALTAWDGGRWSRFLQKLERYAKVDEGGERWQSSK